MNQEVLAILAGVVRHLEEAEEDAQRRLQAGSGGGSTSPWALAGRQSIMRMRSLVQQRVLKR